MSAMEGAGGQAMAGREIGEDRREESWRVMVLRQPRAESGCGDGLGGVWGARSSPALGGFRGSPEWRLRAEGKGGHRPSSLGSLPLSCPTSVPTAS